MQSNSGVRLEQGVESSKNFVSILAILSTIISIAAWQSRLARSILKFAWNCFLKPVRGGSQRERLDSFYAGQADVYDDTRGGLLKGRDTLLQLVASHLKTQGKVNRHAREEGPKIWLDIGGGTGKLSLDINPEVRLIDKLPGWNIEAMDDHMPVSSFDAIYLIDLCEPLLEVARRRFAAKGWKNVHCLHQDASKFVLPEWQDGEIPPRGEVSLVTMSYSLSMVCRTISITPVPQILIAVCADSNVSPDT
jgi:betaine lipid synthase